MSELIKYILDNIDGEYEFVKILSKTALNELTLYLHKGTNKQLVLIKSEYRNDDVFRILRGIEENEYLPTIYEVASEDKYLYIIEEYIEGENLLNLIDKDTKFSESTIKSYLIDICNALEILHSNGIIHRDIKPENIIIKNNHAHLIDLSIAKTISTINSNDTMNLGTIGYAAPEQFGLSQSQPTTDIYAFGVLANELILGVHPTIEIPKGKLGRIIKKCTSTQISKRYQTVEELKKALRFS